MKPPGSTTPRTDAGGPAASACFAAPPWEHYALAATLAVYFVVQFNAVLHHGSWGQDFVTHLQHTARAYLNPSLFWSTYVEGQNNPPLFHLLCAAVFHLTKHIHSVETISLLMLALNLGGLLLLHRLSLRFIESPLLRLAALVFITFLPAGMIHAVVLAADGVTTPTVIALTYTLVRLAEAGRRPWPQFLTWSLLSLAALTFALSIKFTAVALVPAAAAVILATWRARAVETSRAAAALLIVVAPAAALGVSTYLHYKKFQKSNLGVDVARVDPFSPQTELNVRSLLLPRPSDYKLLRDAPPYNAPSEFTANGQPVFELAVPNRYSYAALLHLGTFTDLLNVYQYDPRDLYVGHRTTGQHQRMRVALKTAVPFTLCALVAVPWMLLRSARSVLLRRDGSAGALPVFTVLTVSFAFWLVIVIFLPFTWALGGGYWLPRLVLPSLFGFFLTTFAVLDRLVGATRLGGPLALGAAVAQAVIHLSFLWPWGVQDRPHPSLPEVVRSDLAVRAELRLRFTPRPDGAGDPLLTIGRPGVADLVLARHDGAGNVRFTFTHLGDAPAASTSDPIPADPDRTYHVVIESLPGGHTVLVTVDGREALRVDNWNPAPAFRDEVRVLEQPFDARHSDPTFSGTEVSRSVRIDGGKPWGPRRRPTRSYIRGP